MTHEVVYSEAYANDIDGIVKLLRESFSKVPMVGQSRDSRIAEVLSGLLLNPSSAIIIAQEGDRIVGVIAIALGPITTTYELVANEIFYCVHPEVRKKGIGATLVGMAEQSAINLGAPVLMMRSVSNNAPEAMANVYKKLGYRRIETVYGKELS